MLLFVDLLRPSMLFAGGGEFEPLPLEMLKQIFHPLKDSTFQWARYLFTHLGYGLVLLCHLVVKGQAHHIREIKPSLADVPLNTIQFQLAHCHHINNPNGKNILSLQY
jgi:hypothetical protein